MFIASISCSIAQTTNYEAVLPDMGDTDRSNLSPLEADYLGKQVISDIKRQGDMANDLDASDYLNNIGNSLVSYSALAGYPFTFYLIKDHDINAFALPGGYICIYNGLIFNTQSEAELVSVMSHEIGHVVQHHIFRNIAVYNRGQWLSLAGLLAGGLLATVNPGAAIVAANAGGGMAVQNMLSFSRDFEREADRVGQSLMYNADYDPHAMPEFFQRLKKVNQFNDNEAYAFLRTHPVTSERISEAQERANQMQVKMRPDSPSFLLIREKARVRQLGASKAVSFYITSINDKKYASLDAQYYGLAFAYYVLQQYNKSLSAIAKITEEDFVDHPAVLSLKARDYTGIKKFAIAQDIYVNAQLNYPNYKNLWLGEVDLYMYSHQFKKAENKINDLLQTYPNDIDLWAYAASLYSDANLNNPQKYYYSLGNIQYLLSNYKEALIQYQNALSVKNSNDSELNDIIISKISNTKDKIISFKQFNNL